MMENKQRLKIWLIKEGEDLPIFAKPRLMRVGMLADYLSAQGHEVIWWSSSFNHGTKQYYCNGTKEHQVNDNETIVLLHSRVSYKKNISISRVRYHQLLAKEFKKQAKKKKRPDIILCAWPTSQFAAAAVKYGHKNDVPVILDVRDFWPDIFVRAFPKKMQKVADLALFPLKFAAKRTFSKATGIVGVNISAMEWGCRYARRKPGQNDKSIFIGNKKTTLSEEVFKRNIRWWHDLNVTNDTWNLCFFSNLSKMGIDLDTVIRAVTKLSNEYPDIKLVVGGKGDAEEYYKSVAADSRNIVFAGWLSGDEMDSLMQISKCGVYCLSNTEDFINTFSNKAVQYLSSGLPILNSLVGFAKQILSENQMGLTYLEGNVDSCVKAIKLLYKKEDMRHKMSQNAFEYFKTNFDAIVVNEQFEDYLYTMIRQRNK